jgi:hypothetical protein
MRKIFANIHFSSLRYENVKNKIYKTLFVLVLVSMEHDVTHKIMNIHIRVLKRVFTRRRGGRVNRSAQRAASKVTLFTNVIGMVKWVGHAEGMERERHRFWRKALR